jgi:hypothetical protein
MEKFSKKDFILNYLKNSPWYLWVIRISGALLIFYVLIKSFHMKP